jgi:hypothetical protein
MVLIIIEFALPPVLGKKPADGEENRNKKAYEPEGSALHLSTR